jgi:hypothetical protein
MFELYFQFPHQFFSSLALSLTLLLLVLRLVQKGRLDIAYCWLWLLIAVGSLVLTVRYDWLLAFMNMIGAMSSTTALFVIAFFVIFLLCLQFSLVISHHRRQIKKLSQQLALLSGEISAHRQENGRRKKSDPA